MSNVTDTALSCVVDDTPAIWAALVPWLATATQLANIAPAQIHVHHVCPLPPDIAKLCADLGVVTHDIERFDPRFPYTNKIRQSFTDFGEARRVVLTDVDTAFVVPPPLHKIRSSVAGKLVDMPNPPLGILREIFSAAGLSAPPPCAAVFHDWNNERIPFETLPGNLNGGLYIIERDHLKPLGCAWEKWARWLNDRSELLGAWASNSDQVAFCLGVNELGLTIEHLPAAWNFPLHLNGPADAPAPHILHHHSLLDDRAHAARIPAPRIRKALARVNQARETFPHCAS